MDLNVQRGDIYGFLGLNGAGKSTTIRLLLGMLRPSAGQAEVLGVRPSPDRGTLWRRVGHLVEGAAAYPDLTVRENLEVARHLYGMTDPSAPDLAIKRLGLGAYANRRARTLSSGNLQRLGLARALMHEPELVILDEPFTGLDPVGVVEVRELLRALVRERGMTVFMSSHILSEVERLATRIGIVHRGRLIEELCQAEVDGMRNRRLEVGCRDSELAAQLLDEGGFDPVRRERRRTATTPEGGDVHLLELRDAAALDRPEAVAALLVLGGAPPLRLAVVQDNFEDVFLAILKKDGARGAKNAEEGRAVRGSPTFEAHDIAHFAPLLPSTALSGAIRCELRKVRRSRVPLLTALGFSLAPAMAGLFMIIIKNPERAERMGLISAKAQVFAGAADWSTFLSVIAQAVAVGGMLLFALLAAWIFGREFQERTVKLVLAVPTPRWATVLGKLMVGIGLALLLSLWVFLLSLVVGTLVGLEGSLTPLFRTATVHVAITAGMTALLMTPVAFIASAARGYFAPIGFAILTLFLAQIVAATGWGEWFPWSVPALYSGLAGPEGALLSMWSFILVWTVSALGVAATLSWWSVADQVEPR
jgi:ABC-2 type transport system ATP-binding protein